MVTLWTNKGSFYIYYLNIENDLYVSNAAIQSASAALVFSSGQRFVYAKTGGSHEKFKSHRLLAQIKSSNADTASCCLLNYRTADRFLEQIAVSFRQDSMLIASVKIYPSAVNSSLITVDEVEELSKLSENSYLDVVQTKIATLQEEGSNKHRSICSSSIVSDTLVALGMDNGSICISEIMVPFLHPLHELDSRSRFILTGHTGKVTCLYKPETVTAGQRLLLSSSDDCTIRVWNVDTYAPIATFRNQVAPTIFFSAFENNSHMKSKNWLISVCKRNSVTLFDLDDIRCLYRFFEHDQIISSVSFKFADDFAIIKDLNGYIFVWQLKTGHLDRVESGSFAEEILSGCDLAIPVSKGANDVRSASARQSISAFTLNAHNGADIPLGWFILSI
ncbi:WD40-repeat-containing domain protein [Chytridium lagenaria]|nr:WD40-repeat-containing domain protein [Chytridium lagenaria]